MLAPVTQIQQPPALQAPCPAPCRTLPFPGPEHGMAGQSQQALHPQRRYCCCETHSARTSASNIQTPLLRKEGPGPLPSELAHTRPNSPHTGQVSLLSPYHFQSRGKGELMNVEQKSSPMELEKLVAATVCIGVVLCILLAVLRKLLLKNQNLNDRNSSAPERDDLAGTAKRAQS